MNSPRRMGLLAAISALVIGGGAVAVSALGSPPAPRLPSDTAVTLQTRSTGAEPAPSTTATTTAPTPPPTSQPAPPTTTPPPAQQPTQAPAQPPAQPPTQVAPPVDSYTAPPPYDDDDAYEGDDGDDGVDD